MFAPLEDTTLLNQITQGNSSALGELYDRYGRLVFSLAYNALGESRAAEEVTQDVFIQVWNKAGSYDPSQGKVITWLASIARHRAIDVIRRQNIRPEKSTVTWDECCPEKMDMDAAIEPVVEMHERRRLLLQALNSLPTEQQQALALAYFHGLTQQEIAEHLNEPLGTVKTRIRLAMQKLRTLLSVPDMLDG
jgi:RNA polymerase sigma-70 factor (ECF subfamily)